MAITAREQQILSRSDSGVPVRKIAAELGLTQTYVNGIVRNYHVDGSDIRRMREAARLGSVALLKAIKAARSNAGEAR